MDAAAAALITGVSVSVVNYIVGPWVQNKLRSQRANDPALGWRMAVQNLEGRVSALENENVALETKVAKLEAQVNDKSMTIARQEKVISDQGRMIDARDRYIARIQQIWQDRLPAAEFPSPLPSYAYWLNYSPNDGRN